MAVIIIAGGSGMVGTALQKLFLQQGHEVRILTRSPKSKQEFKWDIQRHYVDRAVFQDAEVLVNLTGANIGAHRWTKANKEEILNSRIQSVNLLHDAILTNAIQLKHFITASAIGFYGHRPSEILDEKDKNGKGFLADVCRQWEAAALKIEALKIPVTILRLGVVLQANDGALHKMALSNNWGIGAVLGKGTQFVSWIHLEDLCRLFSYCISQPLHGIYNAVAPNPVMYKSMSEAISKSLQKPNIPISVPEFMVKLLLGEQAEMVLSDANCSAEKIIQTGFNFQFPAIQFALDNLYLRK